MKSLEHTNAVITEAKLYLIQIKATRKFSFGTWTSRQHVFVSIKAGGETGYGENIISVNQPDISLQEWADWLKELKGLSVSEAIRHLRGHIGVWRDCMTEMTEMALVDLCGKLEKKNALELLGLTGMNPVYGVYVILSDDLKQIDEKVRYAISCGKSQFIKVKLFGRNDLDCQIVQAVRKYLNRSETYLIGDVNCGYRVKEEKKELECIAEDLTRLYEAGLDACEDPAFLELDEWVQLQDMVKPLSLIPDYPMRPSREAKEMIIRGMGDCYNIHPGSAASIIDAIALAERIRQLEARLMIGDDSLVGPGCTIWQQLAIGLSGDWVEAVEKEEDSDFYYDLVKKLATESRNNPIAADLECHGFGVYLDEEKLQRAADKIVEI